MLFCAVVISGIAVCALIGFIFVSFKLPGFVGIRMGICRDCCCGYYCGKDKKRYNIKCWNENMKFEERVDYFVGYMKRKYGFRISNNIIQIINKYNADQLDTGNESDEDVISTLRAAVESGYHDEGHTSDQDDKNVIDMTEDDIYYTKVEAMRFLVNPSVSNLV